MAKKKYLKDYTPPNVVVDSIELYFDIRKDTVEVQNTMVLRPNKGAKTLELNGNASLKDIFLNGEALTQSAYKLKDNLLILKYFPKRRFQLQIITDLKPQQNKALMGLYASQGNLFTQCESEGFRRITYFFDRPDVMTTYTVTIEADKEQYPVLLSNGNRVNAGRINKDRHFVKWHDPYPKPSYLFALVAGDLAEKRAYYTTASGKKVSLHHYCRKGDEDKLDFAIASLKRAMAWDEKRFHLEYDLNRFMTVAVSDFNMGAMENKGLNIFNTKYVLADKETATDKDFMDVEAVVGHEYFHNYTGDRVTCRDWFQLTLKEGLTVFREQEFSADMINTGVKRIEDVRFLRSHQFSEDKSPLAHPIRPSAYEEINNFYTATVYEKGAEVVRMLHTILGEKGFQQGMRLYFKRFDGQAVTCEDFFHAMEDANSVKLPQFLRWYSYAGTPEIQVKNAWDKDKKQFILTLKQNLPLGKKKPLLIPIKIGFINKEGQGIQFTVVGENTPERSEAILILQYKKQSFTLQFSDKEKPVLSFGRGFSAPVIWRYPSKTRALYTLLAHDKDEFVRFEAAQILYQKIFARFLEAKKNHKKQPKAPSLVRILKGLLQKEDNTPLLALLLTLPSFDELLELHAPVDPVLLQESLNDLGQYLAKAVRKEVKKRYDALIAEEQSDLLGKSGEYDPQWAGVRQLMNVLRVYLFTADPGIYLEEWTENSFFSSLSNMTHKMGVLEAIKHRKSDKKNALLARVRDAFKDNDLVMNKYFSVISSSFDKDTFSKIKEEMNQNYFDLTNPNKVRALIGTWSRNPMAFHGGKEESYSFLSQVILKIEGFNPMLATRLASSFADASKLDKKRRKAIRKQLSHMSKKALSPDLQEVSSKILAAL